MATTDIDQPVMVTTKRVYCDGGGPLGHPGVYLNIEDDGKIVCPYCSRTFVLQEGARAGEAH